MKKALSLLAAVAVLAVGATAMASNLGKHDMTVYGGVSNTANKEVCVFCHTPHNATKNRALWNRNNPATAGFRLYTSGAAEPAVTSTWFETGTTGSLSANSVSLMCLSCHDGATSLTASIVYAYGGVKPYLPNLPASQAMQSSINGGTAILGTDLTNDHPININYAAVVAALPGKFNNPPSVLGGGAAPKIIGGYVECASCHDVHNTSYAPFLRDSLASSFLCLDCHNK